MGAFTRMIRGAARAAALLLLLAVPAAADDLGQAKKVYKQFCSHCHGVDMVNPGTSSFDLRKFPKDQHARFQQSVTRGKGDMPAWGDILLPRELELLWLYVSTRGGKEPGAPAAGAEAPPGKQSKLEAPAGASDAPLQTVHEGRLTACLPLNGGVLSARRHKGGAGLDYDLHVALAEAAGLEAHVEWFESEPEEENDPVRESYALLSMGLCDILWSHPLIEGRAGPPPAATAEPPRWVERPDSWRQGTHVKLAPIAATRPYRRAELALVLGPGAPEGVDPQGLAALSGLRVGVQQGALGGAILTMQAPAAVRAASVMAPPGPAFLWRMEKGEFDAALVDVAAYDFHRRQNRITKLRLGSWRHPIGFNLGAAVAADNPGLLALANDVIARMLAAGEIAALAEADGVTFAAPVAPDVAPRMTMATLQRVR